MAQEEECGMAKEEKDEIARAYINSGMPRNERMELRIKNEIELHSVKIVEDTMNW
jgi:hypothetical protein